MSGRERPATRVAWITKRFGSLVANDSIDLTVEPARSTRCSARMDRQVDADECLYGCSSRRGQDLLDGKPVAFTTPARRLPPGSAWSTSTSCWCRSSPSPRTSCSRGEDDFPRLLDRRRARKDVLELSGRYGLAIDPDALVENLPVGIQQRVEIVKALHREASVIILDEPTAVLTQARPTSSSHHARIAGLGQVDHLHQPQLREVQEIADRITVIRRGKVVGSPPPTATDEELAALMVGRASS